jgi:hypothetical protein
MQNNEELPTEVEVEVAVKKRGLLLVVAIEQGSSIQSLH